MITAVAWQRAGGSIPRSSTIHSPPAPRRTVLSQPGKGWERPLKRKNAQLFPPCREAGETRDNELGTWFIAWQRDQGKNVTGHASWPANTCSQPCTMQLGRLVIGLLARQPSGRAGMAAYSALVAGCDHGCPLCFPQLTRFLGVAAHNVGLLKIHNPYQLWGLQSVAFRENSVVRGRRPVK